MAQRYELQKDETNWSVVDRFTGQPAIEEGIPLTELELGAADDLVDLLNARDVKQRAAPAGTAVRKKVSVTRKRLTGSAPPRLYESDCKTISTDPTIGLLNLETDDGLVELLLNRDAASVLVEALMDFLGEELE